MKILHKIARIIAKVLLWLLCLFLLVFGLLWLVLKVPAVQTYLVQKATIVISGKTHTRVELGKVDLGFPKSLILENLFLEDKSHDTLLYAQKIEVEIDMLALLQQKINVGYIGLEGVNAEIERGRSSSSFNYQFIIDSFSPSEKKKVEIEDTTSSPWGITARKLVLDRCKFSFQDSAGGTFLSTYIPSFELKLDQLDLDEKLVDIQDISLAGLVVDFKKGTSIVPDTAKKEEGGWGKILVRNLEFKDLDINYQDFLSDLKLSTFLGNAKLENGEVNLLSQELLADNFELSGTKGFIKLKKDTATSSGNKVDTVRTDPWRIEVGRIFMEKNDFAFDYHNVPKISKGLDFNHLAFQGFRSEIRDVYFSDGTIKSRILSLAVQEQSGFGIRSFKTNFVMDSSHLEVKGLQMTTNHSQIVNSLFLSYPSLEKLTSAEKVKCVMSNTSLSLKDLLLLAPHLEANELVALNQNRSIHLDLNIDGSMEKLLLHKFDVRAGKETAINISGQLQRPMDMDKMFADLTFHNVQTSLSDIRSFLPAKMLPEGIHIPAHIKLKGKHKGTTADFSSNLDLFTSFGNANINASVQNIQSEIPHYDLKFGTDGFHLGQLLGQATLGNIVVSMEATGKGKSVEKADASSSIHVKSVHFNDYTFKNIALKGRVHHGEAQLKTEVNDPNLAVEASAKVGLTKNKEYYQLAMRLLGADLYQLKLTKDHIQVSSSVDVDLKGTTMADVNGSVGVKNILVVKNNKEYRLDSLMIATFNQPSLKRMEVTSSLLAAKFQGNLDLMSVTSTVKKHVNNYFDLGEDSKEKGEPQNFEFEVQINESPFIREVLLPSLKDYKEIKIKGGFNSLKSNLWMTLNAPLFDLGSTQLKDLKVEVGSDSANMKYNVTLGSFVNGAFQLAPTTLNGNVDSNKVGINLQISDKAAAGNKLVLNSRLMKHQKGFRYHILPNGLNIVNQAWKVQEDNYIEFGDNKLYVHEFEISKGQQSISANSTSESKDADLLIKIQDLHLHTLSQIVEQKDTLLHGVVEGTATLKDYQQKFAFVSNLRFRDLAYKTSKVGNLTINAENVESQKYTVEAWVDGMQNDVRINGSFNPTDKINALNFSADVRSLQMKSIESFTGGQLSKSSGVARGKFSLKGSTENPIVSGQLNFYEARTWVKFLNETLYLKNELISVTEKGVFFRSFTVRDTANNTATISGAVAMERFKDFSFDLRIVTNDFLALNTTMVNNKEYFGRIILDSDIKVKGTPELPIVEANIGISPGSYITVAVPESKLTVDRGEGVVVFLYDPEDLHPIMMRRQKETVQESVLKGMDISAKIKIDKESALRILVDPYSGDSLVVRGDADLLFNLDPSGKTSLSGLYTLSSGKYKASIEGVASKEFELVEGGKIIWNGDPMDAQVDLSARYGVRTSARELMTIGGIGGSAMSTDTAALAKPVQFYLFLIMQGELLKPTLSFRLDMAENQRVVANGAIYAKLGEINQNPAELNKQVFSLLVLNKFMSSNAAGGGSSASGFARSSVSRLVSDQLNSLSSRYLKGVELDFDVQSYDYQQGGRQQSNTELNVGLKKNFDRFSVQVGSNMRLQGHSAQNSNTRNFTGDIEVGYKLTDDGRFRLKAFRQNQADAVINNGIITETGAGVVYTRDYNSFKELFRSRKKKKKGEKK